MYIKDDNTFNELREKSVMKWRQDLKTHKDVEVRGGVEVTVDYIESLKKKIRQLEDQNLLKDKYLRKMKENESK